MASERSERIALNESAFRDLSESLEANDVAEIVDSTDARS